VNAPVCWNGQCFVHTHSDGECDHYQYDSGVCAAYLKHGRSQDIWLASLRDAKGVATRTDDEPAWNVDEMAIARRALDEALASLRARVAGDLKWLAIIDKEIGE
jgi:hypothetical protein